MIVRKATQNDAHEIMWLFYNTVRTINRQDYSQEQVEAWAAPEPNAEKWAERQQTRLVYVAEQEGQIVGFAELERSGHIDCFYCHHQFQRQGVGTELLHQLVAVAEGLEIDCLFTEASITAHPFFERQGFSTLAAQEVVHRGVKFLNYRMERCLSGAEQRAV